MIDKKVLKERQNSLSIFTAQKMKFFIKDFFSKCDQIRSFQFFFVHWFLIPLFCGWEKCHRSDIYCLTFFMDLVILRRQVFCSITSIQLSYAKFVYHVLVPAAPSFQYVRTLLTPVPTSLTCFFPYHIFYSYPYTFSPPCSDTAITYFPFPMILFSNSKYWPIGNLAFYRFGYKFFKPDRREDWRYID